MLRSRMKVLYVLGAERDEDVGLLPGRPQRSWARTKYSKNSNGGGWLQGYSVKSTEML